ncbi:4-carboxymuconolactone decarboxylase [Malassezia furfur]|uniref:4-carboxymuconolactone decarboxylase n=1 Tax=Malassezia furfur TaxID=55194 RepID=A0ABY8EWC4_MALFU|nr:4-carboxymuconolactone decarboxylase [Malassezia furfur]
MPYRIEYASTGRASCHGPQPCAGTKIEKGQLRLGVLTEIQGHTSMIWRHWGCTTDRVLAHVKNEVEDDPKELDGFEDLEPSDQESVTTAFKLGRLREEDITPCLREKEEHWREREREKAAEEDADKADEAKPPKRKAPSKKAAKDESDDDDDLKPPPEDLPAKRTRKTPVRYAPSPKKKRRVKAEEDADDAEDDAEDDGSDEEEDYGDSDDESSDVFDEEDAEDDDDDDDEFDDDE